MRIVLFVNSRAFRFMISNGADLNELNSLVVENGFYSAFIDFSCRFGDKFLVNGILSSQGIIEDSSIHIVPNNIYYIDSTIRSLDNRFTFIEIIPTNTFAEIMEKYCNISGMPKEVTRFIMNGKLVSLESDYRSQMLGMCDSIYSIQIPQFNDVTAYVCLGNDLLMHLEMAVHSTIKDMKGEIERLYEIPIPNQIIYFGNKEMQNHLAVSAISNDEFFVFSMKITGDISVIVKYNERSTEVSIPSGQTVSRIKELTYLKVGADSKKELFFEGIKCHPNTFLWSFNRVRLELYVEGTVDQNFQMGINQKIRTPAENGDAACMHLYSRMLLAGIGCNVDLVAAQAMMQNAEKKGHIGSMIECSELIEKGVFTETIADQSYKLIKRASDLGNIDAHYKLAKILKKKGNTADSVLYFRMASDKGHILAQAAFSRLIIKGFSDQSKEEAKRLLQESSCRGNGSALKTLAKLKYSERKHTEAIEMMKKAYDQGSNGAGFFMAMKAFETQSNEEAINILRKCAQNGHSKSMRVYGMLLNRGKLIPKDPNSAFMFIKGASEKGDIPASYYLAKLYISGSGVRADPQKAVIILNDLSVKKHGPSRILLANMKLRGHGCEQNMVSAFQLISKAYEDKVPKSERLYALMLLKGYGCDQNVDIGYEVLHRAAQTDMIALYHYTLALMNTSAYPGNRNDIIRMLIQASEGGVHEATEQLGLMMIEINLMDAKKYLKISASVGLPESNYRIGMMKLEKGKNVINAAKFIKTAADKHHPQALYQMYILYNEGKGVSQSSETAEKKLLEAASLGLPQAQSIIGKRYCENGEFEKGYGILQSAASNGCHEAIKAIIDILKLRSGTDNEVLHWLTVAADNGDIEAAYETAKHMESVSRYYEAIKYYCIALKGNYYPAAYSYGTLLENGNGCAPDPIEAIKYYKLASDNGVIDAMAALGRCYETGTCVFQDFASAIQYYQLAAQRNHPEGLLGLGRLYKDGNGVAQNLKEAFNYFFKASEMGLVSAHFELGICYEKGIGTEMNELKASECFKFAAEHNYSPSLSYYARILLTKQSSQHDISRAMEILESGIKLNESDSMFTMAEYLVSQNQLDEATALYIKAAQSGHVQSMTKAGFLLSHIPESHLMALEFFEKAAKKGDAIAACNAGLMYSQGIGSSRDSTQALQYFRHASERGVIEATYNAAVLMLTSVSESYDRNEIKRLFQSAADKGHLESMYNFGILNINTEPKNLSLGIKYLMRASEGGLIRAIPELLYQLISSENDADHTNAYKYAQIGAQAGDAQSICLLGVMYLNGRGIQQNFSEAVRCFQEASRLNDPDAIYNLAMMYIRGTGIEKNLPLASEYLKKASSLGNETAKIELDSIGSKLV